MVYDFLGGDLLYLVWLGEEVMVIYNYNLVKNGFKVFIDGDLYVIVNCEFVKFGKG